MASSLFIVAQTIFAIIPAVGLVKSIWFKAPLSVLTIVQQALALVAFVVLLAMFSLDAKWIEASMSAVNIFLRALELLAFGASRIRLPLGVTFRV